MIKHSTKIRMLKHGVFGFTVGDVVSLTATQEGFTFPSKTPEQGVWNFCEEWLGLYYEIVRTPRKLPDWF